MAQNLPKPVVLLAFANEQRQPEQYLRNLSEEVRRLRTMLENAAQAGLCELVLRPNATLADILDVFQDRRYRNRIAIFHYGGNANSYGLLLGAAKDQRVLAEAGGLALFLGQQQGLQLVFLNGCSTE